MLKIKILIAVAAITVMLMSFAAPAMAQGWDAREVSLQGGFLADPPTFCDLYPSACDLTYTPIHYLPDPDPGPWVEEGSSLEF